MRKRRLLFVFLSLLTSGLLFLGSVPAFAAGSPGGGGPPDNWEAHPPIHVRPSAASGPTGYSPAQIRHAYGFDTLLGDGSGQVIAIIDAYDAPNAASDLQIFSTRFGLPPVTAANFEKVYAQGRRPKTDAGWALETSLDIEWAHAIAPGAKILLVEAATNSFSNLLAAVDLAVNTYGADVVSMSWGGSEFSGEGSYDSHFNKTGVLFVAASGDSGTVIYPSVSPYVLAVGGTTLSLNADNSVNSETAWSGSGGGISAYETEPEYQSTYSAMSSTNGKRGVPDVAYNADPQTGFPVYDSTRYQGRSGWFQVGGTSAGAPQWAALAAIANQVRSMSLSTNSPFYVAASTNYAANYRDILFGSNSNNQAADPDYDLVTGLGSPKSNVLVPALR